MDNDIDKLIEDTTNHVKYLKEQLIIKQCIIDNLLYKYLNFEKTDIENVYIFKRKEDNE